MIQKYKKASGLKYRLEGLVDVLKDGEKDGHYNRLKEGWIDRI